MRYQAKVRQVITSTTLCNQFLHRADELVLQVAACSSAAAAARRPADADWTLVSPRLMTMLIGTERLHIRTHKH